MKALLLFIVLSPLSMLAQTEKFTVKGSLSCNRYTNIPLATEEGFFFRILMLKNFH